MSFFSNTVRRQSPPAAAGLSRLLLLCRFDFPQRHWSLPAFDNQQEAETSLTLFARGLLAGSGAVGGPIFEFTARGGGLSQPESAGDFPADPAFKPKGAGLRAANLLRRPQRQPSFSTEP